MQEEHLQLAHIAQQATTITQNNLRGVHRDAWRMQGFIYQGLASVDLQDKEEALWRTYLNKEKTASKPPETNPLFPGARRFNYGFEWVAYLLPGDARIAKVPRRVFPEVNEPKYLEYAQDAYLACIAEIPLFTTKTRFERREGTNIMYQPRLVGTPVHSIR